MVQDPFNKEDVIIQDSYAVFNVEKYLKYVVYHILFFLLLGPFTFPLFRIFETR